MACEKFKAQRGPLTESGLVYGPVYKLSNTNIIGLPKHDSPEIYLPLPRSPGGKIILFLVDLPRYKHKQDTRTTTQFPRFSSSIFSFNSIFFESRVSFIGFKSVRLNVGRKCTFVTAKNTKEPQTEPNRSKH